MKRFLMLAIGGVVVVVAFLLGRALTAPAPGAEVQSRSPAEPRGAARAVAVAGPQARNRGPSEVPALALVADADAAGALRLQGLVLDSRELPVEGALVRLDSSAVAPVRTGKDGTFLFTRLPARAWQLEAFHDSEMAGPVTFWLNERTEPVVLHLVAAASLQVHVVEAGSRRALGGASVELRVPRPRAVDADASGLALLQGLPSGRHTLKVSAPGFSPVWRVVDVGAASAVPQSVQVELRSGAAVSGTVVDARGTPVPGARVTPLPQTRTTQALTDARWDGVTADAEGRWRMENLDAGTYRFTASGSRHAPGTSTPVRLDGQRAAEGVTVTLGDAARLSGTVVDGHGQPVSGAVVRVVLDEGMSRSIARQATCDARGAFLLEDLPRRRVAVAAVHASASSTTRFVDLAQDGAGEQLELILDANGMVRGRVESSSGQPIGEAVVMAEPASPLSRGRVEGTLRGSLATVADAGGRFELRGLVPGAYQLRAAPPGTPGHQRLAWLVEPVKAETGDSEVVLRLRRGGAVAGHVRKADGSVPESFTVTLRGASGVTFSAGDGSFRLQDIPAGEYTLYVSGRGFLTKPIPRVKVEEDQDTNLGALELQRGRQLSGRVVDRGGAPVADATVSVSQPLRGVVVGQAAELEHGLQQVKTDAEGRFSLEGLAISPLQLAAEHAEQGRSRFLRVEEGMADQTGVELRLEAVGQLEGTVRRGGEPVSGALIIVTNPSSPAGGTSGSTGTEGGFHFDSLAPGTYTVAAVVDSGAGQQVQRATVTVTANAMARADLELPRGEVTLLVRAESPEGQARAALARVLLLASGPQGTSATQEGASQVQTLSPTEPARFASVSPGSYKVCLSAVQPQGGQAPDAGAAGGTSNCQPVRVSLSPAEQVLTVTMPSL
ncbi:MSCRAMM family protein [Pyxidicoccus xibeiensis]|uniref:MSCRAMM family protein n=1 Tax=Pyxidicoccus xibeiensis TaxID=2906759 RepID=UPI0020A812FF|nr:carboxypeptidase-like regulatory domain-containing protein [Pyxidicoccus xibeiensis]MCP3142451.1 carboxypeptidase-like regulatory domain-containing protein [Pyxidicoccus xibeiensis]